MDSSSSSSTTFEGNAKIILKLSQAPEKYHEVQSDHSSQSEDRKLEPEWLEKFFKRTFFEPCSVHPIRRNELNKYCIDCDASLCQYCVALAPHEDHRLLKIYRHVYKDVVPLDEIEQHIDCSQIQPYRCNKQLVIALTPLPHSGSKTSDDEATCQICKRKLIEFNIYNYCSISCKVEAFAKKNDTNCPPFLSPNLLLQKGKQHLETKNATVHQPVLKANQESELKSVMVDQWVQKVEIEPEKASLGHVGHKAKQELNSKMTEIEPMVPKTNFRTRKRKGIPRRSPFY
ncbi:uncharacterized protein LOC141600265 [Silene latifolia]|uniref:uncharacterized protein LOC141600265 n=1 Tax=Silene latifolia TaxID=37657 RepID=UPI003D787065